MVLLSTKNVSLSSEIRKLIFMIIASTYLEFCFLNIKGPDTFVRIKTMLGNLCRGFLLQKIFFCFVCFVALRPKSTATCMVRAGRSSHLAMLFPGLFKTSS